MTEPAEGVADHAKARGLASLFAFVVIAVGAGVAMLFPGVFDVEDGKRGHNQMLVYFGVGAGTLICAAFVGFVVFELTKTRKR